MLIPKPQYKRSPAAPAYGAVFTALMKDLSLNRARIHRLCNSCAHSFSLKAKTLRKGLKMDFLLAWLDFLLAWHLKTSEKSHKMP